MLPQLIMVPLWVFLPVLLVRAEAQNLTEVRVELGQRVLLNCSVNTSDIYWYMEIHGRLRVCILRTFSFGSGSKVYISPGGKYASVKTNSLQVENITAEDCRLYFCARRLNDKVVFEEVFRIVSGEFEKFL